MCAMKTLHNTTFSDRPSLRVQVMRKVKEQRQLQATREDDTNQFVWVMTTPTILVRFLQYLDFRSCVTLFAFTVRALRDRYATHCPGLYVPLHPSLKNADATAMFRWRQEITNKIALERCVFRWKERLKEHLPKRVYADRENVNALVEYLTDIRYGKVPPAKSARLFMCRVCGDDKKIYELANRTLQRVNWCVDCFRSYTSALRCDRVIIRSFEPEPGLDVVTGVVIARIAAIIMMPHNLGPYSNTARLILERISSGKHIYLGIEWVIHFNYNWKDVPIYNMRERPSNNRSSECIVLVADIEDTAQETYRLMIDEFCKRLIYCDDEDGPAIWECAKHAFKFKDAVIGSFDLAPSPSFSSSSSSSSSLSSCSSHSSSSSCEEPTRKKQKN